jgi:hypothetical protein
MHTYNNQHWLIYTLIGQHWLITKLIDQQILMTNPRYLRIKIFDWTLKFRLCEV